MISVLPNGFKTITFLPLFHVLVQNLKIVKTQIRKTQKQPGLLSIIGIFNLNKKNRKLAIFPIFVQNLKIEKTQIRKSQKRPKMGQFFKCICAQKNLENRPIIQFSSQGKKISIINVT